MCGGGGDDEDDEEEGEELFNVARVFTISRVQKGNEVSIEWRMSRRQTHSHYTASSIKVISWCNGGAAPGVTLLHETRNTFNCLRCSSCSSSCSSSSLGKKCETRDKKFRACQRSFAYVRGHKFNWLVIDRYRETPLAFYYYLIRFIWTFKLNLKFLFISPPPSPPSPSPITTVTKPFEFLNF